MSDLTLKLDTKSGIRKKNKTPAQEERELSYEDAIKLMQSYNLEIKAAAKSRIVKPQLNRTQLIDYNLAKGGILMFSFATLESIFLIQANASSSTGFGVVLATVAGGTLATLFASLSDKLAPIFSPRKARKIRTQHKLAMALYDLKEADFMEQKNESLQKAKKVVTTINNVIKLTNRKVVISTVLGNEGFSIEEIKGLDSWGRELLEIEKKKILAQKNSESDIHAPVPNKELTV